MDSSRGCFTIWFLNLNCSLETSSQGKIYARTLFLLFFLGGTPRRMEIKNIKQLLWQQQKKIIWNFFLIPLVPAVEKLFKWAFKLDWFRVVFSTGQQHREHRIPRWPSPPGRRSGRFRKTFTALCHVGSLVLNVFRTLLLSVQTFHLYSKALESKRFSAFSSSVPQLFVPCPSDHFFLINHLKDDYDGARWFI